MIKNLQIIRVNTNYCDYLRKFDSRVAYNMNEKEIRPFVGILFKIEDCEYFAPLSSPKSKHKKMKNTIDFLKIKNGELGAVNFNNMIPVKKWLLFYYWFKSINFNSKWSKIPETIKRTISLVKRKLYSSKR